MTDNSAKDSYNGSISDKNTADSSDWHTGYIQGNSFHNKEVKYRIVNGMAVFEGDIILASTPKQMERLSHKIDEAIGIKGEKYRWPDNTLRGEIPYTIDSNLPNPQRVIDAIQHWESNTRIRFVKRTDLNSKYYPNYVTFMRTNPYVDGMCASPVGMQGGQQIVTLSDDCVPASVTIHEIGHAVGLWHEQSRADAIKDISKGYPGYIIIHWENIEDKNKFNFDQHVNDGDDIGTYDYCSIMHYNAYAWSKNGQRTIEVTQPQNPCAQNIGNASILSDDDKDAVHQLYENRPPTVAQLSDGRLVVYVYLPYYSLLDYSEQKTKNDSNSWTTWKDKYSSLPYGMWPAIVTTADDKNYIIWIDNVNTINYSNPDGSRGVIGESGNFPEALGDPAAAQNLNGYITASQENFIIWFSQTQQLPYLLTKGSGLLTAGLL